MVSVKPYPYQKIQEIEAHQGLHVSHMPVFLSERGYSYRGKYPCGNCRWTKRVNGFRLRIRQSLARDDERNILDGKDPNAARQPDKRSEHVQEILYARYDIRCKIIRGGIDYHVSTGWLSSLEVREKLQKIEDDILAMNQA